MRRTTISHFSFLIFHSCEAFIQNQGGSTPTGLTLPLFHQHPNHIHLDLQILSGILDLSI